MNTSISQDILDIATKLYGTARAEQPNETPTTVLHIADGYSFAAFGYKTNQPDKIWLFPFGSEITARTYFKHTPPTAAEIEAAITLIEDEVMPIKKLLPPDSRLLTLDDVINDIASLTETSNSTTGRTLSIGNMEGVFNRMAAIITGRPASMDILPTKTSFAASLLILREFMHHLGYTDITIRRGN